MHTYDMLSILQKYIKGRKGYLVGYILDSFWGWKKKNNYITHKV